MELTTRLKATRSIEWKTLLRFSVAADMAVLAFMVLTSGDTLALGLMVVFMIGLGLMRFRGGMIGVIVAGLLSADIALWTVSGAVSNFANGEVLSALLLPAFLGTISLAGVIAASASVVVRKNPAKGARYATMTGQVVLAILLLIIVASLAVRASNVATTSPSDIRLTTEKMQYSDVALFSEGDNITVQLANEDLWWHTFTIDELDLDLAVPMGAERSLTFSAPPGSYDFYCAIPGHEAAGMRGTITVGQ
jgi:uncharacterized cupredoxin-like copper-binding protein